jgi:hypothetical protein
MEVAMTAKSSTLGDDVLGVFERACREEDLEVAEHLLQALELLARRDNEVENMQRAYLDFSDSVCNKNWR